MSVLQPIAERIDARLREHPAGRSLWPAATSQLLGHLVIITFLLLAVTGVLLAFPYEVGIDPVVYEGSAALYDGRSVPRSFASVVRISEDVPGGLLLRRVHEASAHLLVGVVLLHLLRVLYTGAFQGRRALNHLVGFVLLTVALVAGWTGENLPYGLLAGTSLRIGYYIIDSIPYIGEPLALLVYGGGYPTGAILHRVYWGHVLVLPAVFVGGTALHLWLYRRHTPTERPGSGDGTRVHGMPLWPDLARRLGVVAFGMTALVVLSTAFVPWSDIELEGPFRLAQAGNTLQPPWFLFFPEGGMRLLPAMELPLPGGAVVGNVFVAAVLLPTVLLGALALFPWIDPYLGGSRDEQHVLQHPLAVPGRAAALTFLVVALGVLTVGAMVDILAAALGVSVYRVIVALRIGLVALPVVAAAAVWQLARRREVHP